MSEEQIELRKRGSQLLKEAADVFAKIQSSGWEVPAKYISKECKHWSEIYSVN